jgi:hypothetical protein
LLLIDNTVAIGLANDADTMNKKRSKSMDMRFFWLCIRGRVQKHQFVVEHIPGQYSIADFFTKALPKAKYDQFHHYIVVNAELSEGKQAKRMKTVTMEKTL